MLHPNNKVFNITSMNMWNDYGFVSHIFNEFTKNGIDVNIITTSQFSVFVTTSESNITKINFVKKEIILFLS